MKTCKDCHFYEEIKDDIDVMRCHSDRENPTVYSNIITCLSLTGKIIGNEKKPKPITGILPELSTFKERRKKTYLSLRQVSSYTGVCISTIHRMESGKNVNYHHVKKVNDFYIVRGV